MFGSDPNASPLGGRKRLLPIASPAAAKVGPDVPSLQSMPRRPSALLRNSTMRTRMRTIFSIRTRVSGSSAPTRMLKSLCEPSRFHSLSEVLPGLCAMTSSSPPARISARTTAPLPIATRVASKVPSTWTSPANMSMFRPFNHRCRCGLPLVARTDSLCARGDFSGRAALHPVPSSGELVRSIGRVQFTDLRAHRRNGLPRWRKESGRYVQQRAGGGQRAARDAVVRPRWHRRGRPSRSWRQRCRAKVSPARVIQKRSPPRPGTVVSSTSASGAGGARSSSYQLSSVPVPTAAAAARRPASPIVAGARAGASPRPDDVAAHLRILR